MQQVIELARFFGALNERLDATRNAELREYQWFFDSLTPRLETARVLERELDVKLAHRFNVFDYLKSKSGPQVNEATLSRVIADLLDPSGSHGQGTLFLECLLRGLCLDWASEISLQGARIEVERQTDDNRRLDVSVHIDKDHCLAIENKPYASDRPNQVKDYLDGLRKYKKSLLIYLPASGRPPAEESATLDDLNTLDENHLFKIMPYDKAGVGHWEDGFDKYRVDYSLAGWLADCRKVCDVDRLRWFLREAEIFCERQFGGNNVTDTETSTIKEFVLSDERSLKTALMLVESLPDIIDEVKKDVCIGALNIILNSEKWDKLAADEKWVTGGYWQEDETEFSYIEMRRKRWRKQDVEHVTIRLQADKDQWNNWYIGVYWNQDSADMNEGERDLRRTLSEQLEKLKLSEGDDDGVWLCSEPLDEYWNWDSLIPDLFKEWQEGKGRITSHFIRRFVKIAKRAIPIIDGVGRSEPSTSR